MGVVVVAVPTVTRISRDIKMSWDENIGTLDIEYLLEANNTITFVINGTDFNLPLDGRGKGQFTFTKSSIAVLYTIKVKVNAGRVDQKIAILY